MSQQPTRPEVIKRVAAATGVPVAEIERSLSELENALTSDRASIELQKQLDAILAQD